MECVSCGEKEIAREREREGERERERESVICSHFYRAEAEKDDMGKRGRARGGREVLIVGERCPVRFV